VTPKDGLERLIYLELRGLREQVVGLHGSMVATSDGFMVANDMPGLEPSRIAARPRRRRAAAASASR
jgi:predicted regulator of Ras-like GTPase activity (Roadblock/LC7/MglB family)